VPWSWRRSTEDGKSDDEEKALLSLVQVVAASALTMSDCVDTVWGHSPVALDITITRHGSYDAAGKWYEEEERGGVRDCGHKH
jgi:hypothetical protein